MALADNKEKIRTLLNVINNLPNAGSGVSVQPDWNQNDSTQPDFIKNKPFGDLPTGGDTLIVDWDAIFADVEAGNIDKYIVTADGLFLKVSDATPTLEDFVNGAVVDGYPLAYEEIAAFHNQTGMLFLELVCVSPADNYTNEVLGVTFPEKGVYFSVSAQSREFTIVGYLGFPSVKKIDEKYLPNSGAKVYACNLNDDDDVYLYTDATLGSKVTSNELEAVIEKQIIEIKAKNNTVSIFPAYIRNDADQYGTNPYYRIGAIVETKSDGTPIYKTFYTAEYTGT